MYEMLHGLSDSIIELFIHSDSNELQEKYKYIQSNFFSLFTNGIEPNTFACITHTVTV